jgi:pimeloyl-ACP methyl ester carboxylesterase
MLRTAVPVLAVALLGALLSANPQICAQEFGGSLGGWGVVLLDGKQGSLGDFNILVGAMKGNGAAVVPLRMAYARSRMYDATFAQDEVLIDAAIDELRGRGFAKVALGGQSAGGGTVLTYAGLQRRKLDALIAMAPGPTQMAPDIEAEAQRAIRLITEGQGDVPTVFLDSNASRSVPEANFYVSATPKMYLDWNTRKGSVWVDRAKVAKVPRALPVLWIGGSRDLALAFQRAAASALPKNPRSRYVEVDAYHPDVPNESVSTAIEWFASLNR